MDNSTNSWFSTQIVDKPVDGAAVGNGRLTKNRVTEATEVNTHINFPTEPQGKYSGMFNALGMINVSTLRKF